MYASEHSEQRTWQYKCYVLFIAPSFEFPSSLPHDELGVPL
ncbi:MAG: hypothetical protein RLZZ435_1960 [Cyanobacteriota bacterium]|jgi:hypothetical protein